MFTKQHYKAIAKILGEARIINYYDSPDTNEFIESELIKLFRADNPRFDSSIFLDATYKAQKEEEERKRDR